MLRRVYRAIVPGFVRSIIHSIRNFPAEARDFREEYGKRNIKYSYCLLFMDWLLCRVFLGATPDDYFKYRFYDKTLRCRREFVTWRRNQQLIRRFNDGSEDERILVEDKTIFAEAFSEYTKREILSSDGLTLEAFHEFVSKLGRVIIKPADGYNGNDIYILSESDGDDAIRRAYGTFSSHKYTVEEVLTQDGMLHEVNPGTCNTIRVNVINNHGSFEIQNAILRSGQGSKPVDNICAGGVVSWIDIETGIVASPFCDLMGKRVLSHPLTGTVIIGRKIPQWERMKEVAVEVARKISRVRYTSWDIAVISGGDVAIVEGNTYGTHNLQQVVTQIGVWEQYRQYLR